MTRSRFPAFLLAVSLVVALPLVGCDRGASSRSDSTANTSSTVQPTPPGASSSTPLPVSPSGLSNPSTAGTGNDLTNSTRASGNSNVYQPPSSDNPPPGGTPTAGATSPHSTASQSTSSQTRGTSPPPNDGTLPGGSEGNTGSRRGGGKG